MIRIAAVLIALFAVTSAHGSCEGNPDALGTARVLAVDAAQTPRVGRKHFPQTLPLGPKELVLTFDDGPWPGTTDAVLAALRRDCVKATFFLLGRNAASYPQIARRIAADGHTIGHHSYSHPLLRFMAPKKAEAEIDRGIDAIETTLGHPGTTAPFFRFPGFASSPALIDRAAARGMVVFGADVWASDWNPMSAEQQLRLIMDRIAAAGRGIVLFHDTKKQTAAMLPSFLRALKREGYRVVHVIPKAAERHHAGAKPGVRPLLAARSNGWTAAPD